MAFPVFRVQLKGEDPIDVQTSAFDKLGLEVNPNHPTPFDSIYRMAHNALRRTGHENVPRDFNGFLEMLEGDPEVVDPGDDDALDPTLPSP